jgi:hypothetical protein
MVVRRPLVLAITLGPFGLGLFGLGPFGLGLFGCGPPPATAPPVAAPPVAETAAPLPLVHDEPVDAPPIEASAPRGQASANEPGAHAPNTEPSADGAIDEPDERPDAPIGSRDPFNSDVVDDNREGKHIIERALRPPEPEPAAPTP